MPTRVARGSRFETFAHVPAKSGRDKIRLEQLRAEIAAGLASGRRKPADAVLDRLELKYRRLADA